MDMKKLQQAVQKLEMPEEMKQKLSDNLSSPDKPQPVQTVYSSSRITYITTVLAACLLLGICGSGIYFALHPHDGLPSASEIATEPAEQSSNVPEIYRSAVCADTLRELYEKSDFVAEIKVTDIEKETSCHTLDTRLYFEPLRTYKGAYDQEPLIFPGTLLEYSTEKLPEADNQLVIFCRKESQDDGTDAFVFTSAGQSMYLCSDTAVTITIPAEYKAFANDLAQMGDMTAARPVDPGQASKEVFYVSCGKTEFLAALEKYMQETSGSAEEPTSAKIDYVQKTTDSAEEPILTKIYFDMETAEIRILDNASPPEGFAVPEESRKELSELLNAHIWTETERSAADGESFLLQIRNGSEMCSLRFYLSSAAVEITDVNGNVRYFAADSAFLDDVRRLVYADEAYATEVPFGDFSVLDYRLLDVEERILSMATRDTLAKFFSGCIWEEIPDISPEEIGFPVSVNETSGGNARTDPASESVIFTYKTDTEERILYLSNQDMAVYTLYTTENPDSDENAACTEARITVYKFDYEVFAEAFPEIIEKANSTQSE